MDDVYEDDDGPDIGLAAGPEGGVIEVTASGAGRLDKILAELSRLSRTRLKGLILDGAVTLDGTVCADPSAHVSEGQAMCVTAPAPVPHYPDPENIPLDIVYEDADLLVINKQAGLVVHPGAGHRGGTLVNALLYHCGASLSGIGGVLRPGIVHRLDKDTTGLMVVAKSDRAHQGLAAQLADRTLSREYLALVWHVPTPPIGRIDAPIARSAANRQKMTVVRQGGRHAVTHYKVDRRFGDAAALVKCRLETGRTHQIRVHMAHVKHPLAGDPLYGAQPTAQRAALKKAGMDAALIEEVIAFPRQMLHAWRIGFTHPVTGEDMAWETAPPEDFEATFSLFKTIT